MDIFHNNPDGVSRHPRYHRKVNIQKQIKSKTFKDSLKVVTREYCAESSIGGLKHLVDEKSTLIEK